MVFQPCQQHQLAGSYPTTPFKAGKRPILFTLFLPWISSICRDLCINWYCFFVGTRSPADKYNFTNNCDITGPSCFLIFKGSRFRAHIRFNLYTLADAVFYDNEIIPIWHTNNVRNLYYQHYFTDLNHRNGICCS